MLINMDVGNIAWTFQILYCIFVLDYKVCESLSDLEVRQREIALICFKFCDCIFKSQLHNYKLFSWSEQTLKSQIFLTKIEFSLF